MAQEHIGLHLHLHLSILILDSRPNLPVMAIKYKQTHILHVWKLNCKAGLIYFPLKKKNSKIHDAVMQINVVLHCMNVSSETDRFLEDDKRYLLLPDLATAALTAARR